MEALGFVNGLSLAFRLLNLSVAEQSAAWNAKRQPSDATVFNHCAKGARPGKPRAKLFGAELSVRSYGGRAGALADGDAAVSYVEAEPPPRSMVQITSTTISARITMPAPAQKPTLKMPWIAAQLALVTHKVRISNVRSMTEST